LLSEATSFAIDIMKVARVIGQKFTNSYVKNKCVKLH